VYWYISTTKVTQLSERYQRGALEDLAVRLKVPVAEAEVRLSMPDRGLVKKLRKVERKLEKEFRPPGFATLTEHETPPPYFSFRVPGARLANEREFWVAGFAGGVALVLVGASHHAFGGPPRPPLMSPSMHPLRTIANYAAEDPGDSRVHRSVTYAWSAIMGRDGQDRVRLPEVSGLAVTIGVSPADQYEVARAKVTGAGDITTVVIGTPLFILQD
jgi:uncharacterized protein DUF7019